MSENNSNLEKERIDTKETVNQENNELNARINKLYGMSNEDTQKKEYDPAELQEIRKKLLYLLIGIIIVGIGALVVLINPFKWGKETKTNTPNTEDKTDDIVEEPTGELSLSNQTVVGLNNRISFYESDFARIDLFPLYSNKELDSINIPNNIKLYLLRKNSLFSDMLKNNGMTEYAKTCSAEGINISKDKFDTLAKKLLGNAVIVEYSDFNYTYYDDSKEVKLLFTYANDAYNIKCSDYNIDNITKFIQQKLISAYKTENSIELYQRVVFINVNGVYLDPNFETLITNDKNATIDTYIEKGSIYKYTFIEDDNNDYYLSKIELSDGVSQ